MGALTVLSESYACRLEDMVVCIGFAVYTNPAPSSHKKVYLQSRDKRERYQHA